MSKRFKRIAAFVIAATMLVSCDVAFAGEAIQGDITVKATPVTESVESGDAVVLEDEMSTLSYDVRTDAQGNKYYNGRIKSGEVKWCYEYGSDYSVNGPSVNYNLYKFVAPKTGYIKVSVYAGSYDSLSGTKTYYKSEPASASLSFYNSKKKLLLDTYTNTSYLGVKKGKVYYIKVDSYTSTNLSALKVTTSSATDRKIASKKKAKTLKRGNSVNTLFAASTGTSTDWYKFKNTKTRTTKIKIDTTKMTRYGTLEVTAYKGKTKIGTYTMFNSLENGVTLTVKYGKYGTTKAAKGTYYIKVKKSGEASGRYKIKLLK